VFLAHIVVVNDVTDASMHDPNAYQVLH